MAELALTCTRAACSFAVCRRNIQQLLVVVATNGCIRNTHKPFAFLPVVDDLPLCIEAWVGCRCPGSCWMVCTVPQGAIAAVRVKLYPHVASRGREGVVRIDLDSGIAGHTRDERCVFVVAVTDLDIIKAVFINYACIHVAVAPSWTILRASKTTAMQ